MTNEERRRRLNLARAKAYGYAKAATRIHATTGEDGPEVQLATMWASVAEALKDGDPDHDRADERASGFALPANVDL